MAGRHVWPHDSQVQNTHHETAVMKRCSDAIAVFSANIHELSVTRVIYSQRKLYSAQNVLSKAKISVPLDS